MQCSRNCTSKKESKYSRPTNVTIMSHKALVECKQQVYRIRIKSRAITYTGLFDEYKPKQHLFIQGSQHHEIS